jgi:predicted nicotinamide N-methyase
MRIVSSSLEALVIAFETSANGEALFTFDLTSDEANLMPLFSGPTWSAIIWERSVLVASKFLESYPALVRGKCVVELGCGLGVPGVVCGLSCGGSRVVLTDRDQDLHFLKKALIANSSLRDLEKITAVPFDWSIEAPMEIASKAQVILAVECVSADVYGRESLDWLVTAIEKVARRGESVNLILCSVRRKDDGLEYVLQLIQSRIGASPKFMTDFSKNGVELYLVEFCLPK